MGDIRNILFIMYDQLRWDYLSCTGHPHLKTPNFDRLAAMAVRFDRCYVQSPVCGPSRMSTYTGRYVQSHGASGNFVPLRVGEMTLGDHLRATGTESWLVGKTHMTADAEGMARLGIDPASGIGRRVAECGFDVWVRDDGVVAQGPSGMLFGKVSTYNQALNARGYPGENPWHVFANSGLADDGSLKSGWLLKNSREPANIHEEDSETPWLTSEAIRFLDSRGPDAAPWLCHLSYIKPHWPYIAPEPWASMYGPQHVIPANRSEGERADPQPVYGAFLDNEICRAFHRDEVRETVLPAYMGLIAQCDAELGRLLDHLQATGRMEDTMIVLTSDHGDYMGDHWMGEKDLFHDCSSRVPLFIYDPSTQADATRGTVCDALVEAIDLAPTFLQARGVTPPGHILEGRSLMPWLRGPAPQGWRKAAISEYDYAIQTASARLGVPPREARLFMVFDGRFKMMHAEGGFRPMLFDLQTDPQELVDLGADPAHQGTRTRLYDLLHAWARRPSQRVTVSDERLAASRGMAQHAGIFIGVWDEADVIPAARPVIEGRPGADYRKGRR